MIAWVAVAAAQDARDDLRDGVLERVTAAGHAVSVVRHGVHTRIDAADAAGVRVLVASGGDRVALSPDGAWVAYVAPRDGIAAVWVAPFVGGEPRAVTPAVQRLPGSPPAGFVAPPRGSTLQFRPEGLCWTTPTGGPDTCVAPW